jgi:DNA-binding CsgD family transcriptional regulator
MRHYTQEEVARISAEISEAIELASIGEADWDLVAERFVQGFPAAFVAIINQDFTRDKINFASQVNVDPAYKKSYLEYYAYINPWTPVWMQQPIGAILVAEIDKPARAYANTEFYQDWLLPQGTVEGASGLKVSGGPRDLVHLPVHYPIGLHEAYDRGTAAVLRQIRQPLTRAVALARKLSEECGRAAAAAALTERFQSAAFVVDMSLRVQDVNEAAVEACRSGAFVSISRNMLIFRDDAHHAAVRHAVAAVLARDETQSRIGFEAAGDLWVVDVVAVRTSSSPGIARILPPEPRALILARNVNDTDGLGGLDLFARHYRLTPAETRFCVHLAAGDSIDLTAAHLSITRNTARERLKTIFQKCGVHRQSELIRKILSFR